MANSEKCKVCASDSPIAFSLISGMKVPLCKAHVSTSSYPTYPIGSLHLVDTLSDMPQYRAHISHLDSALQVLQQLRELESSEAEEMAADLESMKKAAVSAVLEEFESLAFSTVKYHLEVIKRFDEAETELEAAKKQKRPDFSGTAKVLRKCVGKPLSKGLYVDRLKNVVDRVRAVVRKSASFLGTDPTELLADSFALESLNGAEPTSARYYGWPSKVPSKPEHTAKDYGRIRCSKPVFTITRVGSPQPLKRQRSSTPKLQAVALRGDCRICNSQLNTDNYLPIADHLSCRVCLDCINVWTKAMAKCPMCGLRYAQEVREELERRVPQVLRPIAKRPGDAFECTQCHSPSLPIAHKCSSERSLCLQCCQKAVVGRAQVRADVCELCEKAFPAEAFGEFGRRGWRCEKCRKMLTLAAVSEWVESAQGPSFHCSSCASIIRIEAWFLEK